MNSLADWQHLTSRYPACSTIDGDIQVAFPLFVMHQRQMFDIDMHVPWPVALEETMLGLTNISGGLRDKCCKC